MATSHQRSPIARKNPFGRRISGRAVKIAAPVALVATLAPVGLGVVVAGGGAPASADLGLAFSAADTTHESRVPQVSRSVPRVAWTAQELRDQATRKAVRHATLKLWTTKKLDVFDRRGSEGRRLRSLKPGTQVLVTGREGKGRAEIVLDGHARWVAAGNFSETEPIIAAAGLSMEPCAATGGSDLGLTKDATYTLRSICAAFPQISTYGGRDPHGEHVNGESIDAMISVSDTALGYAVVDFLMAHASELNLNDIIYRQRIWQPGVGWKGMSDRGSLTANHFDHVHVRTN